MLEVGWLILAVIVAVILTVWVTFTLTRLDRLHARVDAAQAAMDAQLVRRAAGLLHVAESAGSGVPQHLRGLLKSTAQVALAASAPDERRQGIENAVGRAVVDLAESPHRLRPDVAAELREAAARVLIARRFYNDAVRDTRALRARRMPRLLHLSGRRPMPDFFDIDDTLPTSHESGPPGATLAPASPEVAPPALRSEHSSAITEEDRS